MFSSITNAFTSIKERAVEAALRAALDSRLRNFGSVKRVTVDSAAKSIGIEVELQGEVAPVVVDALGYELSKEGDEAWISFGSFQASRAWLTTALNEYVAGHKFKVPAAAVIAL